MNEKVYLLNRRLGRKLICMWCIFLMLYVVCAFLEGSDLIGKVFDFFSSHIPMIKGARDSGILLGVRVSNYFSVLAMLAPFFWAWIVLQDDVVVRFTYGYSRIKRSRWEILFLHYVLGIPLLTLFVLMALAAPFGYVVAPGSFGQTIFYWMLNTNAGLLLIGSLAGVLFVQILVILFWLVAFPLVVLFRRIAK
ncbi:hypothetical protein M5C99_13820 [Acidovorax sp. NCPPB 2350]|nr:hypothetical protein M5C99_13820 [Acidovorax sp. NCPPB 2350]